MAVRQFDAVAEVQSALQLLVKNWMLAVPTAVASLLVTIFMFSVLATALATVGIGMAGSSNALTAALGAFTGFAGIGMLLLVFVSCIANAMVMAGAEEAWSGGGVDLSKSFGRALACIGHIIVAGIIVLLMLVVATIIPILGWIVVLFLMMYVLPAIVVGGASGTAAIGDSYRLATKNAGPSIVAFIAVVVAALVGGAVNNIFLHMFGLNFIISLVVGGFTAAFGALVVVRFYDLLRAGATGTP